MTRKARWQRLIQQIAHSNYFIFNGQKPTYNEALRDVEHSNADVILQIRDGKYLIAANAVNGTKGSMGAAYMSQVISGNISSLKGNLSPLYFYNKGQNYKLFMIPALFAIVIMLMTGFLPTLNIVGEKEAGTIEQINVTPVSKWAFILAKLIPYWLIALFVITVCLLLSWAIYSITPAGPLWLIYLLAMLLALFFSSFGLIISNYSDTMQQAIFVMWFFVVILLLLSGLFTPTRSMPALAYLTHLHQPHALLHRGHPYRLRPWRQHPAHLAPTPRPPRYRPLHGQLGRPELQEKQLNNSHYYGKLTAQPTLSSSDSHSHASRGRGWSVGGEEDDFGDSVDAVKFRSNCLRVHDLRIWETTPRGLEVNKYILVAPYEIAQTGGFVVVLYSKVAEPVALLGTG